MIINALNVIICACSFVYTSYILCRLTYFLSSHNDQHKIMLGDNTNPSILWCLLLDMLLLSGFILQHSIMTNDLFNRIFRRVHVEHLNRSIYNACSSLIIHFLVIKWQQIPSINLWSIDTSNKAIWALFTGIHVFAWSFIYSGCIMMDIAELCGLKQVLYRISGRNNPLDCKSKELKRYMKHMRHPSFVGFVIILWLYPFMSLDRLLLNIVLTIYMVLMWTIDSEDYSYHARYFRQKQIEMS